MKGKMTYAAWGVAITLWAAPVLAAIPEPDNSLGVCAAAAAPEYYRINLVSTKRVPGTAGSRGQAEVTFAPSPFTVAVGSDGSYHHDVLVSLDRLPPPSSGVYAVWVTTPKLDQVQPVTVLGDQRTVRASVAWNQFIVVVSLEPSEAEVGDRWSGPIVMRGLSRSGLMHTMAGHGPFQQENCAAYGY